MTASLFQDQRRVAADRRMPAAPGGTRAGGGARVRGARRRGPRRLATPWQRAIGLIAAVASTVACTWYVQEVTQAGRGLVTGSVASVGIVDLNFAAPGVVATMLAHVGEHVRANQLLATEAAPGAAAITAADSSAVTADKQLLAAQAVTGTAAAAAAARAQLARDQAKLAADRQTIAQSRILAPAAGIVTAVDAQPGDTAAPAGVHDYVGQGQPGPVAAPPLFSLLPLNPQVSVRAGVDPSALLPVIQLRTSGSWQVLALVPESSAAVVMAGDQVTVSVPAAGLAGLRGSIKEVLATPVNTADGVMYEAVVTVPGRQASPPLDGMTANVMLGQLASS